MSEKTPTLEQLQGILMAMKEQLIPVFGVEAGFVLVVTNQHGLHFMSNFIKDEDTYALLLLAQKTAFEPPQDKMEVKPS